MRTQILVAPMNSVVLVMDRSAGIVPETLGGTLVAATSSCAAVGTLSECDGETSIALSDAPPDATEQTRSLVFDGVLETPAKRVSVCSVLDEPLLEADVPERRTRVRIWANDLSEPDEIHVMVEGLPP